MSNAQPTGTIISSLSAVLAILSAVPVILSAVLAILSAVLVNLSAELAILSAVLANLSAVLGSLPAVLVILSAVLASLYALLASFSDEMKKSVRLIHCWRVTPERRHGVREMGKKRTSGRDTARSSLMNIVLYFYCQVQCSSM